MERTLLRFVWRNSWRDQLLIVLASFVSFPIILASLYVPKLIVNRALKSEDFPQEVLGIPLEQIGYLFTLCAALLILIFLNNAVKYYINISKGLTGERILRRLRYTIFERITQFPLPRIRRTSPGEIVQVVAAEVEPLGGFAGEVVATPVYQGGQLILYMGFIIAQDPILGLAALILFPFQAYVVPIVQRRVVRLVQSRIRNTREMTAEITETLQGIEDLRLAGAHSWHLARMSERLYTNFRIRYRIFFLKYAVKFFNNVVNSITPFFFYAFGGYLVIEGRLDLGALVAILAAYKDIAPPWKELLAFYQSYSDMSARYQAVHESYGQERVEVQETDLPLAGADIALGDVTSAAAPESGGVRNVSVTLPAGATIALIGEEEGGRGALTKILSGLDLPASGSIAVGTLSGRDLLSRAGRDIALAGRAPNILRGTVRDNVAYGLLGKRGRGAAPEDRVRREREARLTGATPESPFADWVDYERIGLPDAGSFDAHAIGMLRIAGLERELFARGLGTRLDPGTSPDLVAAALAARGMVGNATEAIGYDNMVEAWSAPGYRENATIAENLLHGVPDAPETMAILAGRREVRRALAEAGIEKELAEIGLEVAETLQELLGSLGRDTSLLDQIGLIQHSEREEYARIATIARRVGVRRTGRADRTRLVELAFQLVPARHRLGVLDAPERRARLVAARAAIATAFRPAFPFTRLDTGGFVPGLPIVENILRGRPRLDRRDAQPPIAVRLEEVMAAHGMRDFVLRAGLATEVGVGGSTLSPPQRRRLGLARALAGLPPFLILEGVADDASPEDAELRREFRRLLPRSTIVLASGNRDLAREADVVIHVTGGHAEAAEARRTVPRPDAQHGSEERAAE